MTAEPGPRSTFAAWSETGDPSRHLNEDAWAADPATGVFAVCDGVTAPTGEDGAYPAWAAGGDAARLAADLLMRGPPGPGDGFAAAFRAADEDISRLNRDRGLNEPDFVTTDRGNTTAVVMRIAGDAAHIAWLGDAAALIARARGRADLLTRFQTDTAEWLRERALVGAMSAPERARLFRADLRNRGAPWCGYVAAGFGVLDGTGRYSALLERCTVAVRPGDRLYLASDAVGRALAAQAERADLPPEPEEVIALARAAERAGGAPYHDDATVLIVTVRP